MRISPTMNSSDIMPSESSALQALLSEVLIIITTCAPTLATKCVCAVVTPHRSPARYYNSLRIRGTRPASSCLNTTHKESAQERYDTHHITRSCFCVFTSSTVHTTPASCCLLHLHPYYYSLPGPRLRQIASPLSISRCCPGWKISFALQENRCQDICMLSVQPKIEGATRGELMLKPNSRFPHNSQSS